MREERSERGGWGLESGQEGERLRDRKSVGGGEGSEGIACMIRVIRELIRRVVKCTYLAMSTVFILLLILVSPRRNRHKNRMLKLDLILSTVTAAARSACPLLSVSLSSSLSAWLCCVACVACVLGLLS